MQNTSDRTHFGRRKRLLTMLLRFLCLIVLAFLPIAVAFRLAKHNACNTANFFLLCERKPMSATLSMAMLQERAHALMRQLHNEAHTWGATHTYYDRYDKHHYLLDSGYTETGLGAILTAQLTGVQTAKTVRKAIQQTEDALFNLHLLEADYHDTTPFDAIHPTDLQALQHYHRQTGQVLVISLVEQALRIYQDGRLVKAFLVTTGRVEHPSLPGNWHTLNRLAPTRFLAPYPEGSPDWFPPTTINYSILYHLGGYFIHDSWWRDTYGPGTQFPHADASGNTVSNNGSHGCINVPEQTAAWLYQHTNWDSAILIY